MAHLNNGQHDPRAMALTSNTLGHVPDAVEPETIRQQMARLRSGLKADAAELKQEAKQATQLSFYVKKFPLASIAVALYVGYSLIPAKKEIIKPSDEQLEKLASQGKIGLKTKQTQKENLAHRAALAIGAMAVRAGMAYVGQKFGQVVAPDAGPRSESTSASQL